MSTPLKKFKEMVESGEIPFPANNKEMFDVFTRYKYVADHDFDLDDEINLFKIAFLKMQRVKSGSKKYCYISAIEQGVMKNRYRMLSDVVLALYGVNLMTYAIQRLIVDGKIALSGKKVFLAQ